MPKINWKFLVNFSHDIFVIVNFLPKTQSFFKGINLFEVNRRPAKFAIDFQTIYSASSSGIFPCTKLLLILPSTTQSLFKKTISFPPTPDLRCPLSALGRRPKPMLVICEANGGG